MKVLKIAKLFLLSFFILFISCKETKLQDEYQIVEEQIKAPLLENDSIPCADITLDIMWIKTSANGIAVRDSINKNIFLSLYSLVFGEDFESLDVLGSANIHGSDNIQSITDTIIDRYIMEYRQDCGSFAGDIKNGKISLNAVSYELMLNAKRIDSSEKAIVWQIGKYSYTGGAHGLEEHRYINIDPSTGKLLSLSDIIVVENEIKLRDMIRYRLGQRTDIGIFDINQVEIPSIFYMGSDSLYLQYPVYEIAPYSDGAIKVQFSYQELEAILKK